MERVKKVRDFTSGKVLKNLIWFAIPMAITTFLQMLFNAADVAIVGQFAGSQYQAAVGATSSTVHLIVNLFVGISVGANVAMANAFGAKDESRQQRVVHTAMATGAISGVLVLVLGIFACRPLLQSIRTPDEIIDYSTLYLQIYFLGAPALMVYNFGAAVMRGVGETKKPLRYLLVAGLLNLLINVITVIFFHWHVVGVALGTVVSQCVSAVWTVIDLRKMQGGANYRLHKTRFYGKELKKILYIGVPMGISSCLFSVSNLAVQSAINGYGEMAIAGRAVASNIDSLCDSFVTAIEKSVVTIVGQNVGAQKPRRIPRIIGAGMLACAAVTAVYGLVMAVFGQYVCLLLNTDSVVIGWAMKRVVVVSTTWSLTALMYGFGGALRGMGYSMIPMIINLFFTCIARVLYLWFIYPVLPVQIIELVYVVYPITWLLSGLAQMLMYFIVAKKEGHFQKEEQ